MQSDCAHEWTPHDTGMIVVSDEEFARNPLPGNEHAPRYVPCLRGCGAVIDRGRDQRMVSIPALQRPLP